MRFLVVLFFFTTLTYAQNKLSTVSMSTPYMVKEGQVVTKYPRDFEIEIKPYFASGNKMFHVQIMEHVPLNTDDGFYRKYLQLPQLEEIPFEGAFYIKSYPLKNLDLVTVHILDGTKEGKDVQWIVRDDKEILYDFEKISKNQTNSWDQLFAPIINIKTFPIKDLEEGKRRVDDNHLVAERSYSRKKIKPDDKMEATKVDPKIFQPQKFFELVYNAMPVAPGTITKSQCVPSEFEKFATNKSGDDIYSVFDNRFGSVRNQGSLGLCWTYAGTDLFKQELCLSNSGLCGDSFFSPIDAARCRLPYKNLAEGTETGHHGDMIHEAVLCAIHGFDDPVGVCEEKYILGESDSAILECINDTSKCKNQHIISDLRNIYTRYRSALVEIIRDKCRINLVKTEMKDGRDQIIPYILPPLKDVGYNNLDQFEKDYFAYISKNEDSSDSAGRLNKALNEFIQNYPNPSEAQAARKKLIEMIHNYPDVSNIISEFIIPESCRKNRKKLSYKPRVENINVSMTVKGKPEEHLKRVLPVMHRYLLENKKAVAAAIYAANIQQNLSGPAAGDEGAHALLITGYGWKNGQCQVKLRNSWGRSDATFNDWMDASKFFGNTYTLVGIPPQGASVDSQFLGDESKWLSDNVENARAYKDYIESRKKLYQSMGLVSKLDTTSAFGAAIESGNKSCDLKAVFNSEEGCPKPSKGCYWAKSTAENKICQSEGPKAEKLWIPMLGGKNKYDFVDKKFEQLYFYRGTVACNDKTLTGRKSGEFYPDNQLFVGYCLAESTTTPAADDCLGQGRKPESKMGLSGLTEKELEAEALKILGHFPLPQ